MKFEEMRISNCIKCGSDNIIREVKEGYRRSYTIFCYVCAWSASAANVKLAISKWDGTHMSTPSEVKPLPCYVCSGEIMIKKQNDKYIALCKNCGKKTGQRLSRWDAVKLHNSNCKQRATKLLKLGDN